MLPTLLLLLLLFRLSAAGDCPHCANCSTQPEVVPCHVTAEGPRPRSGPRPNWGRLYPFDLRLFYLTKSNPSSSDVSISARIRWRLPAFQNYTVPVEGFQVDIAEPERPAQAVQRYYTSMGTNITGTNSQVRSTEFFINVNEFFRFGGQYKITVRLLPTGERGFSILNFEFPHWMNDSFACHRADLDAQRMLLASTWTTTFRAIELYPVRQAVNVSFTPAPGSLCIEHYKIRLEDVHGRTIALAFIRQMDAVDEMFCLFEDVPSETPLIVKVTANSSRDQQCACANCNCVTLASQPFELERANPQNVVRDPVAFGQSARTDGLWLLALVLLGSVLAALLLLIAMLFVYLRTMRSQEHRMLLSSADTKLVHVQMKSSPTVLLLDRSSALWSQKLSRFLAEALHSNGLKVRYDQWEMDLVEENIFTWARDVVSEADYILVVDFAVGEQSAVSLSSSNSGVIAALKPNDPRIIHLWWDDEEPTGHDPFVEVVYMLPKHAHHLCSAVQSTFSYDAWQPLLDAHKNRHLIEPEDTLPSPVAHRVRTTPPKEESRHLLSPQLSKEAEAAEADSAYGSMNTGDVE